MDHMHNREQTPEDVALRTIGHKGIAGFFAALAFAAVLLLSGIQTAGGTRSVEPPADAAPVASDSTRFILNALLVPALDDDALPLRFADPRPIAQCGPHTGVRVNGKPLVAGALVPDKPFELEWLMNGCRPFGRSGPRFDGAVRLTVFREDWGFSAMSEPAGLRVTSAANETTLMRVRSAALPQSVDAEEPVLLTAARR